MGSSFRHIIFRRACSITGQLIQGELAVSLSQMARDAPNGKAIVWILLLLDSCHTQYE